MEKAMMGVLLLMLSNAVTEVSIPCAPRHYGEENVVCVCNSTYCDTIGRVPKIKEGQFVIFTSTKEGLRFYKTNGRFSKGSKSMENTQNGSNSQMTPLLTGWISTLLSSSIPSFEFTVNSSIKYQKIMGFGGAFTDSAGINILSLGKRTQEHLLRSYFSEHGIEYNLCRVPIGGTDFSTHPYSYDDGPPDPELEHFSLAKEDLKYKIPLIQRAQEMSEKGIHLVSASWSPPPWMKTNNDVSGFGFLKAEYYDSYSKYLIRWLDCYKEHGVKIWAMSTGNEPSNGVLPFKRFNSLGWLPVTMANFTTNYFGPQIRNSPHKDLMLLAFDDQRLFLPWWIELLVKADKRVLEYIDGIAVHWYWDFIVGAGVINDLHEKYPAKFVLYTEACHGDKPWDKHVDVGSWKRGELYVADIMQNVNSWVTGWLDWNLALDINGGPSWAKNYVDSPILVNKSADEFYKQPMFYALGHITKFIERDAVRVQISPMESDGIQVMAVQNPDGRIVIVILNKNKNKSPVCSNIAERGKICLEIPPESFTTVLC